MHSLRVTCPACEKPMKENGPAFHCESCREIIIFFAVSDASPYVAAGRVVCTENLIRVDDAMESPKLAE
jgi:hypothetical protein